MAFPSRPRDARGVLPFLGGLLGGRNELAELRRRAEQSLVPLGHVGRVKLDDLAVISHQPVHLDFHIGRLCVDRRGQTSADQRVQSADELMIVRSQLVSCLEGAVTPIIGVLPEV